MSRSVGLFIDSSAALEEVAQQVAGVTSAAAVATTDPQVWELRFGDVTAVLSAYRATGDADFGRRYRYTLAARMAEGATPVDSQEVRVLRDVARALHESTDLPALLVLDLQNRAAPGSPGDPQG